MGPTPRWMDELTEEDLQFIKRFVLASGSLKEVAKQYGISYPTVRIRLDKMIEKIKILDSPKIKSQFHRKIQMLVADGRLDFATAKILLRTYEECRKESEHEG